jgi:hypothetical protein
MRTRLLPLLAFPVVAASLLAAPLSAQSMAPAGGDPHAGAPVATAAPATGPVRIDGRLDEPGWASAVPVTRFTQVQPSEGEPATQRTEVRILFDAEAIYIGARLHDTEPVSARLVRRDGSMTGSDWLTVIFDSYHDHRSAFGFEVNPLGVRRDQSRTLTSEDDSWDPVWQAAATVDEGGWTAELRIPFSQLRFNPLEEPVWGIQIERTRARNNEFSVFSFTPTTEPGGIPRFGHLHGLRRIPTGRRLEVLPYSVVRAESVDRSSNPFRDDRSLGGSVGIDMKYRVTSDLTLDATVNPDFGQVEVDPAEVNLTALETRFREKRPFFVEGAEIFAFGVGGGNEVFYSRRIGRAPQLGVAVPLADVPDAARILGAAKLTGRTQGGWSVGVLNAATRREQARFLTPDGRTERVDVEPLSNYFVARLRRESAGGASVVGGMLTAVNRSLDSDALRAGLHSSAVTGGLDFRQDWRQRTWTLSGFVSGSRVAGEPGVLLRTQQAPWRYFQRPDAPGLSVDSTATSLAGLSSQLQLEHRRGRHWRFSALAGTSTPGYEVNDVGFQFRANRIDGQLRARYIENRPGPLLRSWNVSSFARHERNYDGEHILTNLALGGWLQLLNYWSSAVDFGVILPSSDDRLTRGGPIARRPGSARAFLGVFSDDRRRLGVDWESGYERNDEGGWSGFSALGLGVRPSPRWQVVVVPAFSRSHSRTQYLGRRSDPLATATYGARYLFAELDQTTLSVETRLNVTFTPDLSLQVYAQPFVSGAAFGTPAELAAPRTFDFRVYGRDVGALERVDGGYRVHPDGIGGAAEPFVVRDRDFNLRSLRGNAVMRWEWRPGSTLFVAWQQTRSHTDAVGDFRPRRDHAALFDAQPDNVLVIKMNYWLNP